MSQKVRSWEVVIDAYLTYIKFERRLSKNSVENYMRDVGSAAQFIFEVYGAEPAEVSEAMIQGYLEELYSKGIKPSTQARSVSAIRGFFKFLLFNGDIEASPAQFITPPKLGRHLPELLSTTEIDAIMGTIDSTTIKGARDVAILEVLYSCGVRVSELISLSLSDLFFDDGFIRVVGKGDKQRLVPISDVARCRIEHYLSHRHRVDSLSDTLFLNNRGGALSRVMIFTIIRRAALKAGITQNIGPHTFRHSFATHLMQGGANVRELQQMLGHSSILTTEIYTHLDSAELRRSVERNLPITKRG